MQITSLIQLKQRINLVFYFAISNIKLRYKNTSLGILWSAFEPLLFFSVLYVVFTGIRDTESDFGIYLITGIMIFHVFGKGTSGGLTSIISNAGIIKSIKIKREFFPIVTTISNAILALVTLGVFLILILIFQFVPTFTIILFPIVFLLLFVLILGLSFLLSVVAVFVKDVQVIWPIFVVILLFASPIFWHIDTTEGILLQIQQINPLGQLIELGHKLVIDGTIPPLNEWLYTSMFIFAIFAVGYFVFYKLQDSIVEEL